MNTIPRLTTFLWRSLMVVAILVLIGAAQAAPLPCGTPSYNAASDRAIFLWRDCTTGSWSMRAMGGGKFATYSGELNTTYPFASYTPYSVEPNDVLKSPEPNRIQYNLQTWTNGIDGFNFALPIGANACFSLATTNIPVLAGPNRATLTPPFDLVTLGSCVAPPGDQLNLVVFLTDDQRFDTLWAMPNVQAKLVAHGVTFTNAYVPTPLCCPSRASMYSGGFLPQNTGVLVNVLPNGGATVFNDKNNLGAVLQAAGYETLFSGKYLNQYQRLGTYVPPGWTKFIGRSSEADVDWSSFKYTIGSSGQNSGIGTAFKLPGQYYADFERGQVLDFLNNTPAGKPFFVFWSTTAPHPPATPAPGDEGLFPGYVFRGRGYGETDLSDKPRWVRNYTGTVQDDEFVRRQLRSLQSVDRTIAAIIDKITALGQINNTLFIFTSDNGYEWGEHGLWGKNKVYEESIRVPMVVVLPGVAPRTDDHLVSVSLDLGPTLYEIAGVSRQTDGMSLVPILKNPSASWRSELFFEKTSEGGYDNAIWAAVRNQQWKYVKYWTGEEELYDLLADPYELNSRHNDPSLSTIKSSLAARTTQQLGLGIMTRSLPAGRLKVSYNSQFTTWGGVAPFNWQMYSGQLPPGLTLNVSTGAVQGVPSATGTYSIRVRVTDSSFATQAQKARTFVSGTMNIIINP